MIAKLFGFATKFVPDWAWFLIAAAVVAGLLAYHSLAVYQSGKRGETRGASAERAKTNLKKQSQIDAAQKQLKENAEQKQREDQQRKENERATSKLLDHLSTDRDRLSIAERGLQQRLAAALARARDSAGQPSSAAVEGGAPAQTSEGMLTELYSECRRRLGVVAAFADASRIAGLRCEADYDALKPELSKTTH